MKKVIFLFTIIAVLWSNFILAESGDTKTYKDGYNDGYNDGYSDGADTVYKPKEPNLIFVQQEKIPEVKAGEKLSLVINYKNDSEHTAKNIKISPSFENTPIVYEGPVLYETKNSLRANATGTASFDLKTKENAKNGLYSISFKIEYRNTSLESYSRTAVAYFKITGEKRQSIVTVNHITTNPEIVKAGEVFTVSFDLNNIGEMSMKDVSIKLTGFNQNGFMPVDGTDFSYVGEIKANSKSTQKFQLLASKNIESGDSPLSLAIQYKNDSDELVTVEKTFYIFNVVGAHKEEDKKEDEKPQTAGKPKIIIESYNTSKDSIIAGDNFQFSFRFKNTSREIAIKNMKITISSDEGAFMIANGSNTFYVENLPIQGTMQKSISLNAKQDLASKSYPITISFDYEDSNNASYTASEVINIPVVEYSKLVINSVNVMPAIINGQTSLSFDYINMGKAVISNLTASVEGDFEAVQAVNYIGNLEAGNSDYYDIQVTPTKEGENIGTLILSFEDSSGRKIEVKKDFTGSAMPEPTFEDMPYNEFEEPINVQEENYLSVWQYIGIGFGTFIVCFFVAKIITTKIIRKKLEDEI